ncbi:MAG: NAD(P)/FAD-dependent oxidoreductase [Pseudomonadota bacterium]
MTATFDVIIIGAGAAGLFCGAEAGKRGRRVLVIDHADKPAEKVRISGGGRCNFTNLETRPDRFLSQNPHFAKSALSRYTPHDFLELMARNRLTWHEKTLGQLFCDQRSGAVIKMLLDELETAGGDLRLGLQVSSVDHVDGRFRVEAEGDALECSRLVIASGGLSIPKMGASGFAYDVARQFHHNVIMPRPALVPFTFSGKWKDAFSELSGVSVPARVSAAVGAFDEALLFTHRGLSGPAVLQASSYWREGEDIEIDLFPAGDGFDRLKQAKAAHPKRGLANAFAGLFPERLASRLPDWLDLPSDKPLGALSNARLESVAKAASSWRVRPAGTEGWRTAEVTAGGVDTDELSSKTMESRRVPGLYFIGECVDVTGWLGGYNFQWAWASAWAAGQGV